jgi:O-antigen/teichoic acid export membrane protein
MSNSRTTARGAAWAIGSRVIAQGAQFAIGLVLARLLLPSDFGLAASVYAITGLALIFLDLGLGSAIVRWEDPSQVELSTVFWLNVVNGVFFELIVIAISPALADFYGQPVLRSLAPVAGLSFLFTVGVVHQALLSRAMRFRTISLISGGGGIVGSIATLLLALVGLGPMALVIGPVISCFTTSVAMVAASRWRPGLTIELHAVRKVWAFSSGVLGAQSIEYVSQNLDTVLLGRFSGPTVLGFYNKGFSLMLLPVNQITGALGSVVFPMLVRSNTDRGRLMLAYERCAHVIFAMIAPMLVVMVVVAPDLVPVLWGANWTGTVEPLRWLCIAGLARVTTLSTAWLLQVVGRTGVMFQLAVAEAVLTVAGICAGIAGGATGVAMGVALAGLVYLPINVMVCYRVLGASAGTLWSRLGRVGGCLVVVGAVTVALQIALAGQDAVLRLIVCVAGGTIAYAAAVLALDRPLIAEARGLIRP